MLGALFEGCLYTVSMMYDQMSLLNLSQRVLVLYKT